MFNNFYPYTNVHELNLDWLIKTVKEYCDKVESLEIDYNDLKEYVKNYFDGLDVRTEIELELNKLIEDGTIPNIIYNYTDSKLSAIETKVNDSLAATNELNSIVQNSISKIGTGSPKAVYSSLSELQAALPSGADGVYVVSDTNLWYYWNGTSWVSGGSYSPASLSAASIAVYMHSYNTYPNQGNIFPIKGQIIFNGSVNPIYTERTNYDYNANIYNTNPTNTGSVFAMGFNYEYSFEQPGVTAATRDHNIIVCRKTKDIITNGNIWLMLATEASWNPSTSSWFEVPFTSAKKLYEYGEYSYYNYYIPAGTKLKNNCGKNEPFKFILVGNINEYVSILPVYPGSIGYMLLDYLYSYNKNPDYDIIFWGDSLTVGAGASKSFPQVVQEILKCNILNCGVGGETSATIAARQGGNSMIASANSVLNNSFTLTDNLGFGISPLIQGDGNMGPVYVNNESGILIRNTDGTYKINGLKTNTYPYPVNIGTRSSQLKSRAIVIWVGTNSSGSSKYDLATIIDSMVRNKKSDMFIVIGLTKGSKNDYTQVYNDYLKELYRNNFIDIRDLIIKYGLSMANITPTDNDIAAINNGSIPPSLLTDSVHFNDAGYEVIGTLVANKLVSLGFMSR